MFGSVDHTHATAAELALDDMVTDDASPVDAASVFEDRRATASELRLGMVEPWT